MMPRTSPLVLAMLLGAAGLRAEEVSGLIAPNGAGVEIDLGAEGASSVAGALPDLEEPGRLLCRVSVPWSFLESEKGKVDLAPLDGVVGTLTGKRYRVAVALRAAENVYDSSGAFPTAATADYQNAWLEIQKAIARRYRDVTLFEFPLPWAASAAPADVAFLLKKTAVAVTGIRSGGKMILGGIDASTLSAAQALLSSDISAYVDVYAMNGAAPDAASTRATLGAALQEADPGAEIWIAALPPEENKGATACMAPYLRALREGYQAATVSLGEKDQRPRAESLAALRALLPATLTPVPGAKVGVSAPGGAPVSGSDAVELFDAKSLDTVVLWWGSAVTPTVVIGIPTADVGRPTLSDPLGKKEPALQDFGKDNQSRKAAAAVPLRAYPLLARFPREVSQDVAMQPVKVAVTGEEELPVSEIVARYQKFQAEQDDRMRHFQASERIALHYEVSVGTTIDVISDNVFFYRKDGTTEWRETSFYVNGVKWRWGQRPKLPLIQPEKVATVPLIITLGKEFDYELRGRETVEGHPCYVVSFAPRDAAKSSYQGRVWIDRKSFARIQMSVVQTALEPPVISNEETDIYRPVETPSGTFWLAHRITGQQIFSIGGTSTPVAREVDFSDFRINEDGFEEQMAKAESEPGIMFRETDEGYRYFDLKEGKRTVNNEVTKSSFLGAVGAFKQQNLDYPVVPLLGVNYFNFDLAGTGTQLNVLFAGALVTATLNKPDLWGKNQLSVDLIAIGFKQTDRLYQGTEALPRQDVKLLYELADVRLGVPFAHFFRLNGTYRLDYYGYSRADDTGKSFILPQSHLEHVLAVGIEWKRAGYRLSLDGAYYARSKWELWGNPDGRDFDPDDKTYIYTELSAAKDFYLPRFMRLHFDASLQSGARQDRFAKHTFGFFNNRVRGFAGSGVRYDEGGLVRGFYGFNVGEVIRLDAHFDYAQVRDRDAGNDRMTFYGSGLTATLVGPWKTIINLDYGYGLHSDIPGLEHQSEVQLLILKVFK